MSDTIKVLDHGYVTLLNLAGPQRRPLELLSSAVRPYDADDTDPANVARMSFGQKDSGRTREQDLKLAGYLMEHFHSEPFEFIECWFEMKLPLFVAAQFKRHRTARLFDPTDDVFDPSINEMSLRYTAACEEWYLPPLEQIKGKAATAKQGRGEEQHPDAKLFLLELNAQCESSYAKYVAATGLGIAPELARLHLHVSHYTRWVWKQDLWNVLHFLSLRQGAHAQWEAQQYANAIDALIREQLPELMGLYDEYRRPK